eukprot:6465376-Amphidinium_carterae.1
MHDCAPAANVKVRDVPDLKHFSLLSKSKAMLSNYVHAALAPPALASYGPLLLGQWRLTKFTIDRNF